MRSVVRHMQGLLSRHLPNPGNKRIHTFGRAQLTALEASYAYTTSVSPPPFPAEGNATQATGSLIVKFHKISLEGHNLSMYFSELTAGDFITLGGQEGKLVDRPIQNGDMWQCLFEVFPVLANGTYQITARRSGQVPAPDWKLDLTSFPINPDVFFQRASIATYFDADGNLQNAAINEPRPYRSPGNPEIFGLMVEAASTNDVRNNTMQGAVIGVMGLGGTAPTNWFITPQTSGITTEITDIGIEDGIEYIELHVFGEATAAFGWGSWFDSSTNPAAPAAQNDYFTSSFFLKVIENVYATPLQNVIIERSSAGAYVINGVVTIDQVIGQRLSRSRTNYTRKLTGATTAFAQNSFVIPNFTIGQDIDVTVRIGLPQLEKLGIASSPIRTTNAEVTRATDVAAFGGAPFAAFYNASEGTIRTRAAIDFYPGQSDFPRLMAFGDDSVQTNTISQNINVATSSVGCNIYSGGAYQAFDQPSYTANPMQKIVIASAYKLNDSAFCANNATLRKDTICIMPTGVDRIGIGASPAGGSSNGYVATIEYWNTRLSDALVQEMTK